MLTRLVSSVAGPDVACDKAVANPNRVLAGTVAFPSKAESIAIVRTFSPIGSASSELFPPPP